MRDWLTLDCLGKYYNPLQHFKAWNLRCLVMGMHYFSICIVVLSNVLYHILQKSIPEQLNPFISLIISYSMAICCSLFLFPFFQNNIPLSYHLKLQLWPSIALGVTIVGLEVGFLLVYRSGWNISTASVFSNIYVAIFLLPVGILMFKEALSKTNFLGIILCIIGLILVKK